MSLTITILSITFTGQVNFSNEILIDSESDEVKTLGLK